MFAVWCHANVLGILKIRLFIRHLTCKLKECDTNTVQSVWNALMALNVACEYVQWLLDIAFTYRPEASIIILNDRHFGVVEKWQGIELLPWRQERSSQQHNKHYDASVSSPNWFPPSTMQPQELRYSFVYD